MANNREKIENLKNEIKGLKEKIDGLNADKNDASLSKLAQEQNIPVGEKHRMKRTLKGHLAKIYALAWSTSPYMLVSASQDGKLLVWDALTTNKTHAIHLRSNWVMACAFSTTGKFVACGGLDNICSIFSLSASAEEKSQPMKPTKELISHTGYLSSCKFLNDDKNILTGSGDMSCILWDIEGQTKVQEFLEHDGDVMCVSLQPIDKKSFVSAGCDYSAKVWDINTGKCVQSFSGNEGDVNTVSYFPNGQAFVSGAEDSTARLFDLRADRELNKYKDTTAKEASAVTSSAFSTSGRYLFLGYDDTTCQVWDTLTAKKLWSLESHEQRVSCLAVNENGTALCTGSWDNSLKIWA